MASSFDRTAEKQIWSFCHKNNTNQLLKMLFSDLKKTSKRIKPPKFTFKNLILKQHFLYHTWVRESYESRTEISLSTFPTILKVFLTKQHAIYTERVENIWTMDAMNYPMIIFPYYCFIHNFC